VTRFTARAMAALVGLLGLALLDLGPRASAAFCVTLTPPADAAAMGAGAAVGEPDGHEPAIWPPVQHSVWLLDLICQGLDSSPSGSTGSPSAPSTTGASSPALGASRAVTAAPEFSCFFRATQAIRALPPLSTAIFEPPRGTSR